MIVTLTPNPDLDITCTVPGFRPHASHRVTEVHTRAGGKGVNASRVPHGPAPDRPPRRRGGALRRDRTGPARGGVRPETCRDLAGRVEVTRTGRP